MLQAEQLTKSYTSGNRTLTVLDNVSFTLDKGSKNAIVGPSGSGKTTLLGLLAGLDRPTSGDVILDNNSLNSLDEQGLAAIRNKYTGFVFQSFQLIPTLTALENVMVPLELRGEKNIRGFAMQLLEEVGLKDRSHHYPTQLSGGEQQRVALARAFINRPAILFADEPTGNLDADTGDLITELIFDLNKTYQTTLVLVTHDMELALKTDRILKIRNGSLISDDKTEPSPA